MKTSDAGSAIGRFSLTLNNRPVHHPAHPEEEARQWINDQIDLPAATAAVFGLGLGYHLEELSRVHSTMRLLVFEPSDRARELFLQAGRTLPDGCELLSTTEELVRALDRRLVYGPAWASTARLVPPVYEELRREETALFDRLIELARIRRASNLNTVINLRDLWLTNFEANLAAVLQASEATALGPALTGRVGIIVAAGPSLDRATADLVRLSGRAVLISVGTAFKRLTAEGLPPDVCVMIEGWDNSSQIDNRSALEQTVLAVSSVSHPKHISAGSGQVLVFHPHHGLARLVGCWPPVPDGGNVASAAFTLAVIWGLNPIILVGQDLAYGREGFYAAGVDDGGPEGEELISLPGNADDTVLTTREFYSYLAWYEESAAYLAKARPDLRLINATVGGARIKGFERLSLTRALGGATRPGVPAGQVLRDRASRFKRDADYIMMSLASLRREAARAEETVENETLPLDQTMAGLADGELAHFLSHLIGQPPPDRSSRRQIRRRLASASRDLGEWAARLQRIYRREMLGR